MLLLQWIAHASVTRGKHPVALAFHAWRVELQVHQLVHIPKYEHVAIELDDAPKLRQVEGRKFAPAVIETRVVTVVLGRFGEQVRDAHRWDAALIQCRKTIGRERISVQGDERVAGALFLEGIVKRKKTRKVFGVCDERRPYCETPSSVSGGARG